MKSRIPLLALAAVFLLGNAYANTDSFPGAFWPRVPQHLSAKKVTLPGGRTARLNGLFNEWTGAPVSVSGGLGEVNLGPSPSPEALKALVDRERDLFGLSAGELEILHAGRVLGKTYLTARQLVDGRPVLGTNILLRVGANGRVALWGADIVRERPWWTGALDAAAAAAELADDCGLKSYSVLDSRQVWVRTKSAILPAWQVRLAGPAPDERPFGLVDAQGGTLLGFYNDVQNDNVTGAVSGPIVPYGIQDPVEMQPFPHQLVELAGSQTITGNDGSYAFTEQPAMTMQSFTMTLSGLYADAQYEDGPDASFADSVSAPSVFDPQWQYPENGRLDEMNLYYHTNFIHDWYKELDPGFSALDYPVPTVAAVNDNMDNAFWNGYGMYFGEGGNYFYNLALFSDVIYHEYTHGITGNIYPPGRLPYEGESGAMNEAWSDYFACTIHDNPGLARGIYLNGGMSPMRNLDNNRRFPENWVDEVHTDGLIIGGAMWDTRTALGATYTDSLLHYARYGLANTFYGYFLEVLAADDDNGNIEDGTPHWIEIYNAFGDHGIGPGDEPDLALTRFEVIDEDGDGEFHDGERGTIDIELTNDVFLFPPPVRGVTLVASADSGWVQWDVSEAQLGDIAAGESASPDVPLQFTAIADVPTRYLTLRIALIANEGEYTEEYTTRIVLGDPQIMVVDDSGDEAYQEYYVAMVDGNETAANSLTSDIALDRGLDPLANLVTIWYTGDERDPLSAEERQAMMDYVAAGGNLILSGQHIGPQLAADAVFSDFLGVASSIDSVDAPAAQGVEGEPLSEGMLVALVGEQGAWNQTAPSAMVPTEEARPLYAYVPVGGVAAVYHPIDGGGKVVYFGFGLEAVSGISTSVRADEALHPLLVDMGVEVSAPEHPAAQVLPAVFSLGAPYPNPFNPETRVAFTLPRPARVTLAVYNLLGREVLRAVDGVRGAGRHEITLNLGDFASGIYLLRLDTPDGSHFRRAVLVK